MGRSFKDIFMVVFPLTGFIFGFVTYYLQSTLLAHSHETISQSGLWTAIGLGFGCGAVFGIGVGYFVRSKEIEFPVDPSVDIYTRLQLMLIGMGYRLDNQFQKVITFEPTLRAGLFSDRIRIEMMQGMIKIGGPVYHLEKIRAQLGV